LELSEIYEPIKPDLARVEEMIRSAGQADLPWLPGALARDLRDGGKLAELLAYSLKGQGKRLRPTLTLLAGSFYNYNPERLLPMATAVEILHTATLVHDDAIDNSPVRRGQPTINQLWGDEKAILLGDYLIAQAEELAAATRNPRVITRLARTLMTIAAGELAQGSSAFNPELSRQQYRHRITSKTAALFSLATESGAILSQAPPEAAKILKDYGYNLGIAFQIVDDIMDFIGSEAELGKPVGSDLAQGTLTLPAMLLLERYPENNPVREFFQNRDRPEAIKRAIELVRSSSIVPECYEIASDYCARAGRHLRRLPDNASRRSLLDLADYVIARRG